MRRILAVVIAWAWHAFEKLNRQVEEDGYDFASRVHTELTYLRDSEKLTARDD